MKEIKTTFLILICIGWLACKLERESIKPAFQPMTESVYASLNVQPEDLYAVYATSTGILKTVSIEEGDVVAEGQLLAEIEAVHQDINLSNAELNLELAKENYRGGSSILENIEAELEVAKLQLQVDSSNYLRQRNLWDQSIGTKVELDSKRLRYDLAINKLESTHKRYEQSKRELETNYKRSQNSVRSARSNVKDFTIRSNISGTVYTLYKEDGELTSPQQAFAEIGSTDSFLLELRIDESDIARVDIDQQVIVTLDAYPKESYTARLTKIYPQKDARTQTFKAEATFTKPPSKLYPGLTGEANIILQQKQKVLTIPASYVFENNKVETINGIKEVSIGLRGIDFVEIRNGIDTSMVILKPE